MVEIKRVRDRERKIGYSQHKGTETLVQGWERFQIEGVRNRESQLYVINLLSLKNGRKVAYFFQRRRGILELLAKVFRGAVLTQVTTQNIKLTLCS